MSNIDEQYDLHKIEDGGRKRLWSIMRTGDSYITVTGLEGGAQTRTKPTIAKGKNYGKVNATTGAEQASADMRAKVRAKLEKGFKSDAPLPSDLTAAGQMVWKSPTLAHKFKDRKHKVRYPAYVSPKLDGIRCVINKDGMWSRNGKPFVSCPHIFAEVKHLFDANPNLVIDGELYNHSLREDFDKICSLIKKGKPSPADLAETELTVQYWVFDIDKQNAHPFSMRYEEFWNEFKNGYKMVRPVKNWICTTEQEIVKASEHYIREGFEGGMVRSHDAIYVNKRTDDLLKYKLFIDEEFEIVGVEEGQGNRAGMMGRINFKMKDGKLFDASGMGSHDFFTRIWNDREEIIGSMGTVRYQNLTPKGVPRFPVFVSIRDYE